MRPWEVLVVTNVYCGHYRSEADSETELEMDLEDPTHV